MRNQNSLHKLCFTFILMNMLIQLKDNSELYTESEVMYISIYNVPVHYLKHEECEEVTYRVYYFVITSQVTLTCSHGT